MFRCRLLDVTWLDSIAAVVIGRSGGVGSRVVATSMRPNMDHTDKDSKVVPCFHGSGAVSSSSNVPGEFFRFQKGNLVLYGFMLKAFN